MAITTKDIALLAGVSQSTVSRALNNSPLISQKTRDKIMKIAQEQHFQFNASARSLSTNKTHTVGVIFPDDYMDYGVNMYYGELHSQLRDSLEKRDMDLIIAFKENRYSKVDSIQRLITGRKVDGLIIAHNESTPEMLQLLHTTQTPYIFLHFQHEGDSTDQVNQVFSDQEKGGFLATKHLISLGHRHIACVSADAGHEFTLRRDGYKRALKECGIPYNEDLILYGDRTFQSGYNLMMEKEHLLEKITAITAHTDVMALGILEAMRMKNIKVPEQLAVVGYDDIELAHYFHPHLTTIHQPREQIASLACEKLLDLIEQKEPLEAQSISLEPELVIRESCGYVLT
ncbi:MAG: LacI family DNA-binding transcriptional regulator [Sphaerochaetaceae bacterium]|jgi:LacI family transcriptional regulator